jgi:hypothetical protein
MNIYEAVMRLFALMIIAAIVCLFVSAPFVLADSEARQQTHVSFTGLPMDLP